MTDEKRSRIEELEEMLSYLVNGTMTVEHRAKKIVCTKLCMEAARPRASGRKSIETSDMPGRTMPIPIV